MDRTQPQKFQVNRVKMVIEITSQIFPTLTSNTISKIVKPAKTKTKKVIKRIN